MSEKEWSPADIGGKRFEPGDCDPSTVDGWSFNRLLTDEEMRACYEFLGVSAGKNKFMGTLPPDHPFKMPLSDLDHLSSDHPWRKGTIPKPLSPAT